MSQGQNRLKLKLVNQLEQLLKQLALVETIQTLPKFVQQILEIPFLIPTFSSNLYKYIVLNLFGNFRIISPLSLVSGNRYKYSSLLFYVQDIM